MWREVQPFYLWLQELCSRVFCFQCKMSKYDECLKTSASIWQKKRKRRQNYMALLFTDTIWENIKDSTVHTNYKLVYGCRALGFVYSVQTYWIAFCNKLSVIRSKNVIFIFLSDYYLYCDSVSFRFDQNCKNIEMNSLFPFFSSHWRILLALQWNEIYSSHSDPECSGMNWRKSIILSN